MAEYRKLLLTGAKALKLDDELGLVQAVVETVKQWAALKPHLADYASVEDLISKLVAGVTDPNIEKAFKTVDLEGVHMRLAAFAKRIKDGAASIPDPIKKLLTSVGSVEGGKLEWKIDSGDQAVVKTDQYGLELGATGAISFDPGAAWPDVAAGGPKLLNIHAEGRLRANAKGSLPYIAGTVDVSGGAYVGTNVDYYFKPSADALYVAALADGLGHLTDPFDFDSVWDSFKDSNLEGIVYAFVGKANADLQINIADAVALGAGIVGDIKATVAVKTSLDQTYSLKLRRKSPGAPAFRAQLSRQRHTETSLKAALSLEADLGAITRPVLAAFKSVVEKWEEAIKAINPYLSPGTLLRGKADLWLKAQLSELIKDHLLRDAVVSDIRGALGLHDGDDVEVVKWLEGRVYEAFDRGSVLANGKSGEAIDRVWTELVKTVPALSKLVEGDPVAELKAELAKRIIEIDADLKTKVNEQLAEFGGAKLKAAIQKAGVAVNGAVGNANDALKGVRDLLTHYDGLIHKAYEVAKAAAEKKASSRIYTEETRKTGLEVEVTGDFLSVEPPAGKAEVSKVFEALTRGSLQRLVQIIDDGDSTAGFDLIEEESSITRFSETKSKEGIEIVFLGISIAALTEGINKVQVKSDGAGNVYVDTKAGLEKTLSIQKRTRQASFVATSALVAAKALKGTSGAGIPTLEAGIGARYDDKSLSWDEIADFINALKDAKLIPGDVKASAKKTFDGWAGEGGSIDGDVSVALKFSGAAIEKLLLVGLREDGKLTDAGRLEVIAAGLAALKAQGRINQALFDPGVDVARGEFSSGYVPDSGGLSVEEVILHHRKAIHSTDPQSGFVDGTRPPDEEKPDGGNTEYPSGATKERYVEFLLQGFALMNLVDLVDKMGEIYHAAPDRPGVAGGWTPKQYRDAQAAMIASTRTWLTIADGVQSFFESDPSKRTMAFMSAMASLAGMDPVNVGGVVLTMTNRKPDKPAETVSFGHGARV